MKHKNILMTGGAGFIGLYLSRALLAQKCTLHILDNFSPQIHGTNDSLPEDISQHVKLIKADVRDRNALSCALDGVDVVVHLAAETGTGQSMYEISRYFDVNVQGTANLLDILQNSKSSSSVRSLIVASSRAIYGEGGYECPEHGLVFPDSRTNDRMSSGDFELFCPECGHVVTLADTDESAPFRPMSIYGLTKQVQEQAVLMHARTNGINAYALRYQNVFGPGQSLKNPYTGILAVFSNLARQGQPIDVYEDGLESRDFVYIDDVVEATTRAIMHDGSFVGALNVGTGVAVPVISVAQEINSYFGNKSEIRVSGAFRLGDIRHNKAATKRLESVLNFKPSVSFREGLHKFLAWAETQPLEDKAAYQKSVSELQERGLMGQGVSA
jgi:dTDP-L-rhamnose 4-epimerase